MLSHIFGKVAVHGKHRGENLNELAEYYKKQLADGKIQQAYSGFVGYVMKLKTTMSKKHPEFLYGNVSPGYMDYTNFLCLLNISEKINCVLGLCLIVKKFDLNYG